jgi:hypothetical protein
MSLQFRSNKAVERIGAAYRKIVNGQGKALHACVRSLPSAELDQPRCTRNLPRPTTALNCRKRAALDFCFWHVCDMQRAVRMSAFRGISEVAFQRRQDRFRRQHQPFFNQPSLTICFRVWTVILPHLILWRQTCGDASSLALLRTIGLDFTRSCAIMHPCSASSTP